VFYASVIAILLDQITDKVEYKPYLQTRFF